jgi:hypothetical protein
MSATKASAALPQQTLTVIKFAPRRPSEEFVECLRVMAESVIKESRLHVLLNAQPPEIIHASSATFYFSPYFVKFLSTFDGRIRGDSEWFSWLDDIQAVLSQETPPDQRFTPHLIAQIRPGRLSPKAQRTLHEVVLVERQGKAALLGRLLAPKGLLLASGESNFPQTIRFGRQWIKNQDGQVPHVKKLRLNSASSERPSMSSASDSSRNTMRCSFLP